MRQTLLVVSLMGVWISGCSNVDHDRQENVSEERVQETEDALTEVVKKPPAFVGAAAKERVWPDLSGTWQFTRTAPPEGSSKPATPWKRMDIVFNIEEGSHKDENGQGSLTVVNDKPPQFIRWDHGNGRSQFFSIQKASRHVLIAVGDDGWGYLFVRTEGGH